MSEHAYRLYARRVRARARAAHPSIPARMLAYVERASLRYMYASRVAQICSMIEERHHA